jgi:hypothetical protein
MNFSRDCLMRLRCNRGNANAWLVQFDPRIREPPQESVVALHSDGQRCGLSWSTGLLGLCTRGSIFCCFPRHLGSPDCQRVCLRVYYLGGVGVRDRSRYAAAVVLIMFVADMATAGPGVLRVLIAALLLSNLRATWIATRWKPQSDEAALPPRFSETWGDKFADKLPMFLWPKVRVLYYVFSACFLLFVAIGLAIVSLRRGG